MARHKVHYSPASLDPEPAQAPPACGARQRTLLPLLFSSFWPDVTCRRCRRHAPEVPSSPLQQLRRFVVAYLVLLAWTVLVFSCGAVFWWGAL